MLTLAASLVALAAAAETAPSLFVMNGNAAEILVLEPVAGDDGTGQDGGEVPPPKAPVVKKGTPYRVVDLKGAGATVTASADGTVAASGCGGMERPMVPFDSVPAAEGAYMLVPEAWAGAPKSVSAESAASPAYEAIARPVLEAQGLKDPKIAVGQAIKTDLDGDGTEDVILSIGNTTGEGEPKAGDYNAVLIQRTKDGKPEVVMPYIALLDEGNLESAEGAMTPLDIVAIADVNGDSKMEIVILNIGYEEHFVEAWSLKADGTIEIVAQAWCGV